jgi:hypothetical protein
MTVENVGASLHLLNRANISDSTHHTRKACASSLITDPGKAKVVLSLSWLRVLITFLYYE